MKEILEPGERRNTNLEVLKAKELAHEIPPEIIGGVNIAIQKANKELEKDHKLTTQTRKLLKNLYKEIEKRK